MTSGWPLRNVQGEHNPMAVCRKCDRDATQTRVSYYCIDVIDGGPYLCDECRTALEAKQ